MYSDSVDEASRLASVAPRPRPRQSLRPRHPAPDAASASAAGRAADGPSSSGTVTAADTASASDVGSTPTARPARTPTAHRARRQSRVRVTFALCLRHRITGLAAEAAFWVLLSLPALALGTVGVLGYLHGQLGAARAARLEQIVTDAAGSVLSQRAVRQTIAPALHSMLTAGHADVVSVSFLIALWSGSRALNVAIDTITVASGQSGLRGIVRTRLLAFGLYLPALLLGAATVPLLLAGTELLDDITPGTAAVLGPLVWPLATAAGVAFLTTLYHLALPHRRRWLEDLPGAFVALAMWAVGSVLLRLYLHSGGTSAVGGGGGAGSGTAGFGRIAATAAILLWLYITALAVLIGAVYNAVRHNSVYTASATRDSSDVSAQVATGAHRSDESAGEKAVERFDAPGENIPKTPPVPSPRMTRSSA